MVQTAQALWHYRGLVGNFTRRELKSRYKGSLLGWAWSLLNPLATVGLYTLVFGFFLKFPPPTAGNGKLQNFAIYLFTALIVWNFFLTVATGSMQALIGAGPLLRKISFPAWTPVCGSALAVLVQTVIELGIAVALYLVLGNVGWTILLLPVLLVLLVAFSLGLGLVLALLNARLRDVAHLAQVGFNLLFYATPIVYPIELVRRHYGTHSWARLYELNPVTQFVEAFRDVLYSLRPPSLSRFVFLAVVSLGTLAVGAAYFVRGARDVSEEL
ncbi:MAG: ABC transporter permease [Pseudonocardiaceae bacterium]